jgi:hypothetical protein
MNLTQTDTLTRESSTSHLLEPGDHERMSHYADKKKITEALVLGTPIQALCGKVWVPTRDGEPFPLCPECEEAYAALPDK